MIFYMCAIKIIINIVIMHYIIHNTVFERISCVIKYVCIDYNFLDIYILGMDL